MLQPRLQNHSDLPLPERVRPRPLPLTPATTPTALMATSAAEVAGSDPVSDAADPPGYVGLVEEIASPISQAQVAAALRDIVAVVADRPSAKAELEAQRGPEGFR
jgi:hypothetical protein